MKTLAQTFVLAAALAAPALSFAQSSQTLTRAQVREQLVQIENAGYMPGATDAYDYPHNLRSAEARIASQKAIARAAGYRPSESGATDAGEHMRNADPN